MSVGMWRAALSGWRVFVPVVLGNAAVQSLLIVADPVPEFAVGFCALFVASLLALVIAIWLTVCTAAAAVDGAPHEALRRAWRRPVVLAWVLGIGLLAIGASLLALWLAPLVLVLGAFVLPAAAVGEANALTGYRAVQRAPIRSGLAVLATLVVIVVSWVLALVFGFFVTGVLGAALSWLWFGVLSTLLLCQWCSLHAACRPSEATVGGDATRSRAATPAISGGET